MSSFGRWISGLAFALAVTGGHTELRLAAASGGARPHGSFDVAEIINGRLLAIAVNGHAEEIALPRSLYFTVSRISQDGTRIAGFSSRGFAVATDHLRELWRQAGRGGNVVSLALSPDGTKIAFATAAAGESRRTPTTWNLSLINSSGEESELGEFSYNEKPLEPVMLTWDPLGRRLTFSDKGEVRMLDTLTLESQTVATGLDPTWSPDGRWIAYRSAERRIVLLDLQTGRTTAEALGTDVTSSAHWSPDSQHIFVDEKRGQSGHCDSNSRFVVYDIPRGRPRTVYDPCLRRDWNFGWIAHPDIWISAAKALRSAPGN